MQIPRSFLTLGIFGVVAGCTSSNATPPSTASPGSGSSASQASVGSGSSASQASVGSGSSASSGAPVDSGGGASDATSGTGNGASDAGVANGSDGGSEAAPGDGGTEAASANGGDGGKAPSADGGGDAGSCTLPSCLGNLDTGCMPTGTCSQTTDDTTDDVYSCYTNGITRGDLTDPNTGDQILTAKNATSTCYSIDYVGNDIGSDTPTTATVTNHSDAGVATLHMTVAPDGVTTSWSVTCSGAAPVALDSACKSVWPLAWMINERNGPQDCTASTTCKF